MNMCAYLKKSVFVFVFVFMRACVCVSVCVCVCLCAYLEKDLQVLCLCVEQDVWLQVFEDGNTHVHLVVWPQNDTGAHVVTDLRPVQVVPKALTQPLHTHLKHRESE